MKKYILILLLLVIVLPFATARQGHIVLLAMSEMPGQNRGSTADLHLDIKPGNGRVFIDTYPFTKLDTQMSVRFAKEMACSYTDIDCTSYDFFYTIRSDSVIIGGPSAGAALTVLTIGVLNGWDIDRGTTITGTINPGGIIGTVGGIPEKIAAASDIGLDKVLIPKGALSGLNGSPTIEQLSLQEGIEIVEVITLDRALEEFTGRALEREDVQISVNPQYESTMQDISDGLCQRTQELLEDAGSSDAAAYESALNLTRRAEEQYDQGAYYSAASFCFGANIALQGLIQQAANLSETDIFQQMQSIKEDIRLLDEEIENSSIDTMTALQAFMIVKERLIEAEGYIQDTVQALSEDDEANAAYHLSYAQERSKSAYLWAMFMDDPGMQFTINQDTLRSSCIRKVSEAEERYQYASLYVPDGLADTREGLDRAYRDLDEGRYELCLIKASKSKAESDLLLGSIGLTDSVLDYYLDTKLDMIERNIQDQQEDGIFPILGYSYYEYAKSLRESDRYSAMLYTEYALELSNLDIYFEPANGGRRSLQIIDLSFVIYFVIGSLFGGAFIMLLLRAREKDDHIRIKLKKRK